MFVSETAAGRISIMHPETAGARSAATTVYLSDLKQPFGIAFYPTTGEPRWLYVAETQRVTRFPVSDG